MEMTYSSTLTDTGRGATTALTLTDGNASVLVNRRRGTATHTMVAPALSP
jgi:hypothetical protein